MLSKETLSRMSDESRFPIDEVSALAYKMLLQHCVEMDYLDALSERWESNEELDYDTEVAAVADAQREVHAEFVKRFPNFKYAAQLSYAYNMEEGQPQMVSVDPDGNPANFKEVHDFARDAIVHQMLEYVFKYHTQVFEDGQYEFSWERTGREHDVTYTQLPVEGQSIH